MQQFTDIHSTLTLPSLINRATSAVSQLSTVTKTMALMLLATTGRMACFALPQVQPVTAICILAGVYLGWRAATSVAFGAAVLSNFYFGQGPWTLEQGLCWALVGCAAFGLSKLIKLQNHKVAMLAVGMLLSVLFGVLMDVFWAYPLLLGGSPSFWAVLWAGVSFNMLHAYGTVAFLLAYCAISQGLKQVVR